MGTASSGHLYGDGCLFLSGVEKFLFSASPAQIQFCDATFFPTEKTKAGPTNQRFLFKPANRYLHLAKKWTVHKW